MILERDAVAESLARFDRRAARTPRGRAAVAIVLFSDPDDPQSSVWMTRRSPRLRAHAGQWALPGGRIDEGESTEVAALRELDEELAIRLDEMAVLGSLDDYVTRSGFCITPVVLWAGDDHREPVPNPGEVESVHSVTVDELDVEPYFVTIPESPRPVVQVPILGSRIHAPTGAILYQFREVVVHGRETRVDELEQPVFAWR